MTRSSQNVFAAEPSRQGRQGSHLLVAGRDSADSGWPAAENALLPWGAEQLRGGALADDRRSVQPTRRSAATQAVSLACGGAGKRSAGGAGLAQPSAAGTNASVRLVFAGIGIMETAGPGWFLRTSGGRQGCRCALVARGGAAGDQSSVCAGQ